MLEKQPLKPIPIRKWVGIGIFSERGTSAAMLMEWQPRTQKHQPKRFASYQLADSYILANQLGDNASPVEVYEE